MIKKLVYWAAASCLVMWMVSCASSKKVTVEDLNGEWTMVTVDGKTMQDTEEQPAPFIGFDAAEKRVYGNAGCNLIVGVLKVKNETIDLSDLGSTMMACPDAETETLVFRTLATVKTFKREGDKLMLLNGEGKVVTELVKK